MRTADKIALIEQTLTRAAEQIGDVTAPAMARYYHRLPAAKAAFDAHCRGNLPQLEGQMVENALHCLMHWFESPGEIEIMLSGSVLHHHDTLDVPPTWYSELIDATADVLVATIPPDNELELAAWEELRRELRGVVAGCANVISTQPNRQQQPSN